MKTITAAIALCWLSGCASVPDDWTRAALRGMVNGTANGAATRMALGRPSEVVTVAVPGQPPRTIGIYR